MNLQALTRFMRKNQILRISNTDIGVSVFMRGDIWATGEDAEEAFQNAVRQRDARAASMGEAA